MTSPRAAIQPRGRARFTRLPVFVAAIVMVSGVLTTVLASPVSAYIVATDGFAFIDSEEGDAGGRGLQSHMADSTFLVLYDARTADVGPERPRRLPGYTPAT